MEKWPFPVPYLHHQSKVRLEFFRVSNIINFISLGMYMYISALLLAV